MIIMRYFSILHTHRFGQDNKIIKCEGDFAQYFVNLNDIHAQSEFLRESTTFNWEPDLGEEIFIDEISLDNIPEVTLPTR